MNGLRKICSALGRLIRGSEPPERETPLDVPTASVPASPAGVSGIHPGLTDQQLVVLLTAAACEILDGPVRVDRFRPLTARDLNWATQGRRELHTHRLK